MRIRIEIKTPKGQAIGTSKKLKPFIIGFRKTSNQVYANKADDTIIWIVDGTIKDCLAIQRNLTLFSQLINGVLGNKMVQGVAKLSKEDKKELDDMLHNQTTIRVIKLAEELPNMDDWIKASGD